MLGFKLIFSLAIIVALGPAAIDMYLASMPEMAKELHTSYASTQMTLTVFLIFMGMGQLVFGPISDAIGRKTPLLLGLVVYLIASFAAALAPQLETLILARVFQGIGASMAIVVVMSMVRDLSSGTEAAQLYALLNTIVALGPIVAPAIGGFVGAHYGWRGVMCLLGIFAVVVLINTLFNLKESLAVEQRIALNIRSILQTYVEIAFDKQFLFNLLALSAVYFFLFAYIGGSSFVYQNYYGLSTEQFGLVFGLTSIFLIIGASSSAYFVKKMLISRLAILGAVIMMLGTVLCMSMYALDFGLIGTVSGIALGLLGLGILEATLMAIAMEIRDADLGSSAALLGAVPMLLSSIATPIAGYLVEIELLYWLMLLSFIGPFILILVWLGTKKVSPALH